MEEFGELEVKEFRVVRDEEFGITCESRYQEPPTNGICFLPLLPTAPPDAIRYKHWVYAGGNWMSRTVPGSIPGSIPSRVTPLESDCVGSHSRASHWS